jgi:GNAT superfamily N-acetyltransferase
MTQNSINLTFRPALSSDLTTLTAIKGAGSQAVHLDRIQDAIQGDLQYWVLTLDGELIGYACLAFRRPSYWSDAGDETRLPQIVDLTVADSHRGRGYGSHFVSLLAQQAAQAGYPQLYISVDPLENPRAYQLYQRLGFQQIQSEPYYASWEFVDSEGNLHRGESWTLDMVKAIPGVKYEP